VTTLLHTRVARQNILIFLTAALLVISLQTTVRASEASNSGRCKIRVSQCLRPNSAASTGQSISLRATSNESQAYPEAVSGNSPASATQPPQRWAYVPACPANGPPGTLGDTLCIGATESCGQAGQVRFREYLSIGNGPWVATRTVCLGAAEFQQANTPLPPLVLALDVWRRMLFPDPKLTIKPGAGGLANLESYFWISGPFTQSVTATAGPNQVTVDAVAASYEWRFGDGSAPLVTGVPGRPWPARSEIAHAYPQLGRFEVQVTVRWQGRFRVNGGPAQVVPGPPVARSSTVTYPVRELQTVLTR
jgi:hypothetical protein